jgi:pimeloyl-ACP methyl ester carboxylesterase
MSFSRYNAQASIGTLLTALGGPQSLLTQLGDNSTATIIPVPYNDTDTFNGSMDGAAQLLTAIQKLPSNEKIVVFGHSYGSVSACQLLRQQDKVLTGIDPARLQFVLIGNSIRPNTGLSTMLGLYGGSGPTTASRFRVRDIVAEFDKWADYPNVSKDNAAYNAAINNCNYGDMAPNTIHVKGYDAIRLSNPHAEMTIGQVTFMLFKHPDPIPTPVSWYSSTNRAQLAKAYNRNVKPNW